MLLCRFVDPIQVYGALSSEVSVLTKRAADTELAQQAVMTDLQEAQQAAQEAKLEVARLVAELEAQQQAARQQQEKAQREAEKAQEALSGYKR